MYGRIITTTALALLFAPTAGSAQDLRRGKMYDVHPDTKQHFRDLQANKQRPARSSERWGAAPTRLEWETPMVVESEEGHLVPA